MITRLIRWLRNTDTIEQLGDYIEREHADYLKLLNIADDAMLDKVELYNEVAHLAVESLRLEADLEYAKEVLYAIATSPHVNSREDMIDLAYETYTDLNHD